MLFTDTLGGPMQAEKWGVTTQNKDFVFVHVFEKPSISLEWIHKKGCKLTLFKSLLNQQI
jgi:hypothetical protein